MSSPDNTLRPRNAAGSGAGRASAGASGTGGTGSTGGTSGTSGSSSGRGTDAAQGRDLVEEDEDQGDEEGEDEESPTEAEGESYVEETDWERVGIFGAGLAIGALLGAGVALLLAPQSGADTREAIVTRVRTVRDRVRDRASNTWEDLGDELRHAARRGRKRMRRGLTRSRWAAADAIDRD